MSLSIRAFLLPLALCTATLTQLPAQSQTWVYRNSTFVGVQPDGSSTQTVQQVYPQQVDSTYSTYPGYSSYSTYSSYPSDPGYSTYSTYPAPNYVIHNSVIQNRVQDSTLVHPVIVNPTIRNSTLVNPVIVSPQQSVIRQPIPGQQTNPACMAFSDIRIACH